MPSPTRYPSRPLCYVRPGGSVIETCTNTIGSFPLLRPGPDSNERIFGVMGKATEYYEIDLHGFGFAGTHYHLLYSVENALQMSRFQGHMNSNIAREVGRLHDWRDKFWARRYRGMGVSDDRASQRQRLKYMLAQGTQEGLVARPLDMPGPNAARILLNEEPGVGYWFNRTKEYYARRKGLDFGKYDFATRYEIELKPLPAFRDDSPEEYRTMVAEILEEIEEEAAAKRGSRPVLGAERLLVQDPCCRLASKRKKAPAAMLFFSVYPEVRKDMSDGYLDHRDDYRLGSQRLVEAAERGYRPDPGRFLPEGSFSPAAIEAILKAAVGFNPEAAFPKRSFPRAWPFVGGELPPPPPTPPSRPLVIEKIGDKWTIVERGKIPTIRVPCRAEDEPHKETTLALVRSISAKEVQAASRDPALDCT